MVMRLSVVLVVGFARIAAAGPPSGYQCDPGTAKKGVGCSCPAGYVDKRDGDNLAICAETPKAPPQPAVVEHPSAMKITTGQLGITGDIRFEGTAAKTSLVATPIVRTIAKALSDSGNPVVEIAGHTDNAGPHDLAVKLTQYRAEAVRTALIAAGVAADRLVAKGYGPDKPFVPNVTPRGREQNNRIELHVQATPKPTDPDLAAVGKLFDKGTSFYNAGDFRAAAEQFEAAYKLKPLPELLYNAAKSYARLPDAAKAIDYYERYLKAAPNSASAAEVRAAIATLRGGAAPKPDKQVVVTSARIEIKDHVYFETNKDVIKPVSFPILDDVAQVLTGNPKLKIEIQGHTDSAGDDDHNMKLSQARADAVRTYLVKHGIDSDRLTARGYGETQPVASNDTEAGRAQNRRIEFFIR